MKNTLTFEGLITCRSNRDAILWTDPLNRREYHYKVDPDLVWHYGLVNGTRLQVAVEDNKINRILSICNRKPEEFNTRRTFASLTASSPEARFDFGSAEFRSLRIMDMFIPVGKGTRALIVSPPRAGKTVLLEELARGFARISPDLRVILLLIDERPEEVTHFKQNTMATVFHRTLDQDTAAQVALVNLLIDNIQTEVECGNDIVVLVDSLTRLTRSFNRDDNRSRGRTMTGGIGVGALEIPRKLFGMARMVPGHGSCTILATILTGTGSRMDDIIFQEFKGTGNCEIILDRELAEERIFPAINLRESGTRKEELLIAKEDYEAICVLRRKLVNSGKSSAIMALHSMMEKYTDNKMLLRTIAAEIP
ncbi:MAG: transcription termination factor Rho [Candidatus Cloacimonetes bacterium]|nr:transcription termination factor Rho [Candidatus Cloacimonadota bacterium]